MEERKRPESLKSRRVGTAPVRERPAPLSRRDMRTIDEKDTQAVQDGVQEALETIDTDNWDVKDSLMAARFFIDGLVLNKADEAGSWMAAAAYKIMNPIDTKDTPIGDIVDTMQGNLDKEATQFRQEHPVAGTVANIAGGIMSPVSLKGGQMLGQINTLRKGNQAKDAALATQSALRARQGTAALPAIGLSDDAARESAKLASQYSGANAGAATSMAGLRASAAPNAASRTLSITPSVVSRTLDKGAASIANSGVNRLIPATGLAAAEGAAFGYEGDTTADKMKGAASTAAMSALFPPAIAAGGAAMNIISKSRLAQDLGKGRDFINLMYTEHGAADIYRHLISKSFGAGRMVEQQVMRVVTRLQPASVLKKQGVDLTKDAKRALTRSAAMNKSSKESVIEKAKTLKDDTVATLNIKGKVDALEMDEASARRVDSFNTVDAAAIRASAVREADAAVNASEAGFRADAFKSALPSGATADEAAELATLAPQDALNYLDRLWTNHGFKAAKAHVYTVDSEELVATVKRLGDGQPEALALLGQTGKLNAVTTFVEAALERVVSGGMIKGSDLVDLRSNIGVVMNGLTDNKQLVRGYIDAIQEELDGIIMGQLPKKDAADFLQDRSLWRNNRMVDASVSRATGGGRTVQGSFTADDWLDAARSNSSGLAARGKIVLMAEAQEQSLLSKSRDAQIHKVASDHLVEEKAKAVALVRTERGVLARAKIDAAKVLGEEKRAIAAEYAASAKSAGSREQLQNRLDAAASAHKLQLAAIDEGIAAAKKKETELIELSSRGVRSQSLFERLFADGVLGQAVAPITPVTSTTATVALGTGIGAIGALPATQRALAGQTSVQRSIQAGLEAAGDISARLNNRGFALAPTAASVQGEKAQEAPMFSGQGRETILSMPPSAKERVRNRIKRQGLEEKLRSEDPELYGFLFK